MLTVVGDVCPAQIVAALEAPVPAHVSQFVAAVPASVNKSSFGLRGSSDPVAASGVTDVQ